MKSSIYFFQMKMEILVDFQICISVPLNKVNQHETSRDFIFIEIICPHQDIQSIFFSAKWVIIINACKVFFYQHENTRLNVDVAQVSEMTKLSTNFNQTLMETDSGLATVCLMVFFLSVDLMFRAWSVNPRLFEYANMFNISFVNLLIKILL